MLQTQILHAIGACIQPSALYGASSSWPCSSRGRLEPHHPGSLINCSDISKVLYKQHNDVLLTRVNRYGASNQVK